MQLAASRLPPNRWDKPVTVHKIVIRESGDRISDFIIQRFDETRNDWIDLRPCVSRTAMSPRHSRTGEKSGWGYFPNALEVDGRPLLEGKDDRVFGNDASGERHPVFTIIPPEPLTTSGVRLKITGHESPVGRGFRIRGVLTESAYGLELLQRRWYAGRLSNSPVEA